jgi:hypothetical protein
MSESETSTASLKKKLVSPTDLRCAYPGAALVLATRSSMMEWSGRVVCATPSAQSADEAQATKSRDLIDERLQSARGLTRALQLRAQRPLAGRKGECFTGCSLAHKWNAIAALASCKR